MSGRRFDAVAFDLFGTLVPEWESETWTRLLDDMAEALGMRPESFRQAWADTVEPRLTGGYATLRHNLEAIAPEAAPARVDEALSRRQAVMEALVRPLDDVEPTVRHLRERGLRVGLVSMCSPEVPELWRALPVSRLFDAVVFSSEDGVRKPHPEIYALAAERLGVLPERVLYVGDGSFGELTGAVAAGMTAVLIRHAADAERVIARAEEDVDWSEPAIDSVARVLDHL